MMATEKFITRHNGPHGHEIRIMLEKIGVSSVDELIDQTVPKSIRLQNPMQLAEGISEFDFLKKIKAIASKNKLYRTFIGAGFYGTITPSVIVRNIFENPSWYTSYTPYQAEISQGRLEALLNFQTTISDLTGMELANASLLDESTAASEAMMMMRNTRARAAVKKGVNRFFIDENIFPQTREVVISKAEALGVKVVIGNFAKFEFSGMEFGALLQYPAADGSIIDYSQFVKNAHNNGVLIGVAADILSLALLTPPGEWGADIVVGSTQRLGIPIGYGGPHAGYFATREKYKRNIPGRIIGVSKDVHGNNALRMALQTREQHIKREKATSNICTAQALLATMAGMYAVYHGAEGLQRIALHAHNAANIINTELRKLGIEQLNKNFFDTLCVQLPDNVNFWDIQKIALKKELNLYYLGNNQIQISTDETTSICSIKRIVNTFAEAFGNEKLEKVAAETMPISFEEKFKRTSDFLTTDLFKRYRTETEMMRYIKQLERKDFSLTHSMISLGSCTMKLNAATEMLPLSWMEFGNLHPFVPIDQAEGYHQLFEELEKDLCAITGFEAISLQPNSGAAGEYTGLRVIAEYHKKRCEGARNIVLIPASAHGTNPASAIVAGMKVVVVACDENGNIKIDDLKEKAEKHKDDLAAFMVTYPSTHGVFEEGIIEMCQIIHNNGGQVYMDGANMNAQVGLTNPAIIGADVCHLNLHKTFAIPHGGGGPGVGPIGVAAHLAAFLPSHPVVKTGGEHGIGAVAAAPWGSAMVLPISYGYIKMAGRDGLTEATKIAILNANYLASMLKEYFGILYTGANGRVAHEMILECRNFKGMAGITEGDIAKRLMDYGFHAPTLSFPVHGTLMVEPTESESLYELDRFIEAMISIYNEIMEIKDGKVDATDNVLKNAPHTAIEVTANEWKHEYGREKAAYPLRWIAENKFWPSVARIDDAFGDRNLFCNCTILDNYREEIRK